MAKESNLKKLKLSMSLKVSKDKGASTWDILSSLALDEDGISPPLNEKGLDTKSWG